MHPALPGTDAVGRIACLMLGGIGDYLVTTPTILALRERYPAARLTLIQRAEFVDAARGHPAIDEIVAFRSGNAVRKALFLGRLAARRWDLWVDLQAPTFNTLGDNAALFRRNALMMRMPRTRWRLGFAVPQLAPHLTHAAPVPSRAVLERENLARTTLRLVRGDAAAAAPVRKELPPVSPAATAELHALLAAQGVAARPRIGLFFGSNQPAEVWPYARVHAFCEQLRAACPGHAVVIFGGPREAAAAARLAEAFRGPALPVVSFAGRLSLPQTAALLAGCAAVVATNSGPMHMADALGCRLVMLSSTKGYVPVWAPLSTPHAVISHAVPCSPCLVSVCVRDNLCMNLIDAGAVLAALLPLLDGAPSGAA